MASKIISREILRNFTCLPKLVNGKVAIVYPDSNTYRLVRVSKWTDIKDHFDPTNYVLVNCEIWGYYIDAAKTSETEHYLVVDQINSLRGGNKKPSLKVGDKIHLKDKQGMYTILSIEGNVMTVTCKSWQYNAVKFRLFHIDQYKCHAGGLWNF